MVGCELTWLHKYVYDELLTLAHGQTVTVMLLSVCLFVTPDFAV